MAMANNELAIVIKVVNDQLVAGINQAKSAVSNFAQESSAAIDQVEEKSENLAHVWKGMFEAFIGIEIVNVLKKIADAADDASNRLQIAANTAKNFGHALDPNELEKWLDAFARSPQGGGYALPDMRNAVQTFAASGQDENQQKRALADAANLAATFGFTLPEAVHITNEALTGHVEMLTRYGVITREAAKNIHTVEDAMRALEAASAGGAEKRADGLAGAFGRLGTSINLLGNAFGHYLIPYFDAVANGLTKIADAVAALPPWLLQAVAGLTFVTLSLTALGLILPALKLGVEFLAGGFGILRVAAGLLVGGLQVVTLEAAAMPEVLAAVRGGFISAEEGAALLTNTTGRTQGALGLLRTFIGGPLVAVFNGFVSILRTVITALAVDLVGADAAAAGSFAAMISPILAVIAIIAGVAAAAIALSGHWNDVMKGLSTAWDEFYNNVVRKAGTLRTVLAEVAMMLNPTTSAVGGQLLGVTLSGAMSKTSAWIDTGVKGMTNAIVGAVKTAWNDIVKFFSGGGANVPVPKDKFDGTLPGTSKSTAEKAAANAFQNFDAAVKDWLDAFQRRVDEAQAHVDTSKAKIDAYKATLPDGKPQTVAQETQYEKLLADQLYAEEQLRARILEQQSAQEHAADRFAQVAASISPHLKNHDQLVRQATAAMEQHRTAAEKLKATVANIAAEYAGILKTMREIHAERVDAAADVLTRQMDSDLANRTANRDQMAEDISHAEAQAKTASPTGEIRPEDADAFALTLAHLAEATTADKEATAEHTEAVRKATYEQTGTIADYNAWQQAITAATSATNAHVASLHRLDEAQATYQKAIHDRVMTATQALDDLVTKINVPGLQQRQGGGFTFSPMQFLLEAFEQTKAFADVMKFVNQLVKVFAQLLDNLRPVLDVVIRIVTDVANVFIFLYNTVARILRLFGIHLQLLDAINSAYSNQIPLIQITHNIPTLNELAAGKLNSPLSPTPTGATDSLTNIGNTHTSLLESILATLIAIKLTEMVFGHGGGGGGILGMLSGLFKLGGGAAAPGAASAAGGPSLQGAYAALQTLPGDSTDAISAGTQAALAADGASTSGGLFTAMNGAMQSASPYLASAIGAVLGGLVGGGGGGGMSSILGGIGGIVGTMFGGPVGGAIGGFVGSILGGLFGHHKSADAPKPTTQTTEFTALLHAATDVHAWMNGLTANASSMLASVAQASTELVNASRNLNTAAKALAAPGARGGDMFVHSPRFDNVHIHDDRDIDELDRDLANRQMRRFRQFAIDRGPIG